MLFPVIGWTIIHSLWQCLGLLAMLKLFLGVIDVRRSGVRYTAALGVLGVAVMGVLATFVWEWRAFAGAGPAVAGGGAIAPVQGAAGVVLVTGGATGLSLLRWLAKAFPFITAGWIAGVVFYTGRLLLSGIELRRMRGWPGVEDAMVHQMLEGLRGRMGILKPVRLLITDRITEPMTFGFLRAVLVLPLSYVGQVPAGQLELILAHELAHIRRRDYIVNLVQHVFDALLFFNPFYRMISGAVREEREYCCDDRAALVGGDHREMAVALTNLGLVKRGLALGLSVAPERRSFYRRVTRLIEPQRRQGISVRAMLIGVLAAAVMVGVLTQCTRSMIAQDSLPAEGDRILEVLSDNQAGYREVVYNYTRAGLAHDIFMVKSQDNHQAMYGYKDGVRLNPEELSTVVRLLKAQKAMSVVLVLSGKRQRSGERMAERINQSDSIEKQIQLKTASGEDMKLLLKMRNDLIHEEVTEAMDQYKEEVKRIPLDVEQHELLTRIIKSNDYTAADRQQLNELIRKRGAVVLGVQKLSRR